MALGLLLEALDHQREAGLGVVTYLFDGLIQHQVALGALPAVPQHADHHHRHQHQRHRQLARSGRLQRRALEPLGVIEQAALEFTEILVEARCVDVSPRLGRFQRRHPTTIDRHVLGGGVIAVLQRTLQAFHLRRTAQGQDQQPGREQQQNGKGQP